MRAYIDILNRRVEFAAPPVLGETELPLTIVRKDDDTFADPGTGAYRITISNKQTNIAAASLSRSTDGKTLSGTISLNTTEAQAVFAANGYPTSLDCIASVKLLDVSGNVDKTLCASTVSVEAIADDGGDVTSVTISQDGSATITAGTTYIDITFGTAFASAPTVVLTQIEKPSATDDDLGSITISNKTTSGFRASFSAAPSASGYKLNWYARA